MQRYNKLSLIIAFLIILTPIVSLAQIKNTISVDRTDISKQGDNVNINMDILIRGLELPSNDYITITPILRTKTGELQELPVVILNGKNSQKRYNRSVNLNGKIINEYQTLELSNRKDNEIVAYRTNVPYQTWMNNADIILVGETCNCGKPSEQFEIFVENLTPAPVVFPTLSSTFITPPVEAVKNRELTGEAFVIFPVNKVNLLPELGNNNEELQKIKKSLDYIHEEKEIVVESINIDAYASPEGSLENNIRLAKGRADALKNYIVSNYGIGSKLITSQSKGENWDGLIEAIKVSGLTEKQKQDIWDIININDENTRKARLKAYEGGKPYQQMLVNIYPSLRKSVYKINYVVPGFSLEKAKEILKTKPDMLSLNEIYMIANNYDKNSEDFKSVFDIAIKFFPRDTIANINAAGIELEKGNTDSARKYLKPYMSNEQAYNNIGLMYAQEDKLDEAERYFKMAADKGDKNATDNLFKLIEYKQKSGTK